MSFHQFRSARGLVQEAFGNPMEVFVCLGTTALHNYNTYDASTRERNKVSEGTAHGQSFDVSGLGLGLYRTIPWSAGVWVGRILFGIVSVHVTGNCYAQVSVYSWAWIRSSWPPHHTHK